MLLNPANDPMGTAIHEFWTLKKAPAISVTSNITNTEKMPVKYLFRSVNEMPLLEQLALKACKGHVLDVGAAAGSHALALQQSGLQVTAIDISALAVDTQQKRGVQHAQVANFFSYAGLTFDTLLFMMNGIGICGNLQKLPIFFSQCRQLLKPGGQVILDSSDLIYLYTDDDGAVLYDLNGPYYGELTYKMTYKTIKGAPFNWLFIDFDLLSDYAAQNGFGCELLANGEHYDYLARLTVKP